MTYRTRERLAFWLGQAITAVIAFATIWFASRLGYEEAIRYARYEEARKTRNRLRELDRELASNEQAIRAALEDWDGPGARNVTLNWVAYDRAKESDEYFLLDPQTTYALSQAYADWIRSAIEKIRNRTLATYRTHALNLSLFRERIEDSRPRLKQDLDKIEADVRRLRGGKPEVGVDPPEWPVPSRPPPTDDELAATKLAVTPGWARGAGGRYLGPLEDLSIGRHVAVPVAPRGPAILTWTMPLLPDGRKPARLWLCFTSRAPFERAYSARRHEEELRKIYSFEVPGDPRVLNVPVESREIDVVDPNLPLCWRWVYGFLEDDAGQRFPLSQMHAWKVGGGRGSSYLRLPGPQTIVLPVGYLQ